MRDFTVGTIGAAIRKFGQLAVLSLIVLGCYGNPQIGCPNCRSDGGDATSDIDGDAATDAGGEAATERDASTEAGGAICGSGSKLCDGKCVPAVACCAPCSCEGLPKTCGPNADESCCTTVLVKGGTFNRDNDSTYPATLGDFHLDRFEITVGRFTSFVNAGQGLQSTAPQAGSGKNDLDPSDPGWDPAWDTYLATTPQALTTNVQCLTSTFLSGDAVLPMNCINWYEAYAFCIWDGGRLPSEAEWTYAAAGGGGADGQRIYPWSTPPSSKAGEETYAVNYTTTPAKVGSRSPEGDGKWSQADLVGNVGEWLNDYGGAYPVPCANCANRVLNERRVLRGGDWTLPAQDNTLSRAQLDPATRENGSGARCARR